MLSLASVRSLATPEAVSARSRLCSNTSVAPYSQEKPAYPSSPAILIVTKGLSLPHSPESEASLGRPVG